MGRDHRSPRPLPFAHAGRRRRTTELGADDGRALARARRAGIVATTTALIVLSVAACGGGRSPVSVAHVGETGRTTTSVPPAAGAGPSLQQLYLDTVAYIGCMRSHGVPNLPVPTTVNNATEQVVGFGLPPNKQSPQYKSANKVCQYLLPGNGTGPSEAMVQQAMARDLKFSACMRSHGLPGFPDPKANSQGVSITGGQGIDPKSPQYQRAQNDCRSLSPVP
jgi:hypothetical protein